MTIKRRKGVKVMFYCQCCLIWYVFKSSEAKRERIQVFNAKIGNLIHDIDTDSVQIVVVYGERTTLNCKNPNI